jgi:hypothetical protein
MGLDINMLAEYCDTDRPPKWRLLPYRFKETEGYWLYAILADVRNSFDIVPIDSPRGFPKDYSYNNLMWGPDPDDGFSPSWLTFKEIFDYPYWDNAAPHQPETLRRWGESFLNELNECMKMGWDRKPKNYRVVFNFD